MSNNTPKKRFTRKQAERLFNLYERYDELDGIIHDGDGEPGDHPKWTAYQKVLDDMAAMVGDEPLVDALTSKVLNVLWEHGILM